MATTREYGPLDSDSDPMRTVPISLVGLVRTWANRDVQALPNEIIMDGIRYAVDTAYRTLRIPPLEHTVLWTDTTALAAASGGDGNIYQSYTSLSVPSDLIEFIHIRGTDANGLTTRVFNEKTDIRSFWDICSNYYNQTAFWSRQGDQVLITPSFANVARGFYGGGAGSETQIEMYYYRRLPALDAIFNVTPQNFADGLLSDPSRTPTTGSTGLWFDDPTAVDIADFEDGNLTVVRSIAEHADGTLWFHGAQIDWPIEAANWNTPDRDLRLFQTTVEAASQGELWFGPERVTERHVGGIVSTNRPILSPTTGQRDSSAIDDVFVIRDGVEVTLTEYTGTDEVTPEGMWRFNIVHTDGTVSIVIGVGPDDPFGEIVEISYFTPPTDPENAGDAHDARDAALGITTSFFFRGHVNFDLVDPTNSMLRVSATTDDFFDTEIRFTITGSSYTPTPATDTAATENTLPPSLTEFYFTGTSVPNWFKDENEKIVLYGALAQCFAYLQEDDQSGKYLQLMQKEIDDLNNEDRVRDSSGGNVQVQYSARGLI